MTKPRSSPFQNSATVMSDERMGSDRDGDDLARLGYTPELKRSFSRLETFGIAFSIIGLLPSISSTLLFSLPYAGPVGMVWGWLAASSLILCIGLVQGEMASSMPTSAGLYYWTHHLAPKKYRNFLAWMVGYNWMLANVAGVASIAWGCSTSIFAAASIYDETFAATGAQKFGLFAGIVLTCGALCAYFTSCVARVQTPSVILNAGLGLAFIVALPIARRHELNSVKYTFTHFENLMGYPDGFSFILSLLGPVWTICGFHGAAAIAEEASNAAIAVPQAIVGSISVGAGLGFVIMIVIALGMGTDLAAIAGSSIGQPLAYICVQAFGKNGALVLWSFMCLAQVSMVTAVLLPASRQTFALARDGALPMSGYFHVLSGRTGTPVRTCWLVVCCALPLGLLVFADPVHLTATNAIFSLAILGAYVTYCIPIGCRLLDAGGKMVPGPFNLGRLSKPIAWVAMAWLVFACVIFCFPSDLPTSASTMNYALVVAAGIWMFPLVFWFLPKAGGRTFFRGPAPEEDQPAAVLTPTEEVADEKVKDDQNFQISVMEARD